MAERLDQAGQDQPEHNISENSEKGKDQSIADCFDKQVVELRKRGDIVSVEWRDPGATPGEAVALERDNEGPEHRDQYEQREGDHAGQQEGVAPAVLAKEAPHSRLAPSRR